MLEGNLYRLVSLETSDGAATAVVALDPSSVIYKAHFRGMPITPGVCLVQIAVELASRVSGRTLTLTGAKDIKFLQPVLPGELTEITYTLKPAASAGSKSGAFAPSCAAEMSAGSKSGAFAPAGAAEMPAGSKSDAFAPSCAAEMSAGSKSGAFAPAAVWQVVVTGGEAVRAKMTLTLD